MSEQDRDALDAMASAEQTVPGTADLETCRRSPLFEGADNQAVRTALVHGRVMRVKAGTVLLQPGVLSGSVFILLDGGLAVHTDGPDSKPVALLEPGACVGELSVVDSKPPSAWVRATNNTRVLVIPGEKIWDVLDESHRVALNILKLMAVRSRETIEQMRSSLKRTQSKAAEAEHEATHDALTGLHNRRWLETAFQAALLNSEGQPVALAMMDVDRFKNFNDTYGHQAGDRALQHVSERLQMSTRNDAMCARYGGEEFALLLPGLTIKAAQQVCERVCEAVRQFPVMDYSGEELQVVTLSIGLTEWDGIEPLEVLIERADEALYRAKVTGRDRVVAAPVGGVDQLI